MAIDYVIDYGCFPKMRLETEGIIDRLKSKDRAATIIQLYRRNGDTRPPTEMGFEMERTAADGSSETQVVIVQHLLDMAAELTPYEHYCRGCAANRSGQPFGCMGKINYPISSAGEAWLLDRLPGPEEPLVWLLLKQGVTEMNYDGSTVRPLRVADTTYFSSTETIYRRLGEFAVSSDQIFEMTFLLGDLYPNHAGVLLLFFEAIDRQLEADRIMAIGKMPKSERQNFRFEIESSKDDDTTTDEIKEFLYALYLSWQLNVRLLLDV